jgi:uncharacterized protein (TIGR03435 family)
MRTPIAIFGIALACAGYCQSPPAFEVASVKPSDGLGGIDIKTSPTRFSSTCNLRELIIAAYSVERWQVAGGPAWLDSDLFAIEATSAEDMSGETDRVVAAGRPAPRRMMLMLQSLLAERFGVKVHRETRQDNVFELVVAKGGPRLQASKDTARSGVGSGRTGSYGPGPAVGYYVQGFNATTEQFAHSLEGHMHGPVMDHTGVKGSYDFRFEYGDDSTTGNAPPFLTAMQDATGLKLNATKGPVEFLVVDHADKPSAN